MNNEATNSVIVISHTNYIIKNDGTERVIKSVKRGFNEQKIKVINFFALDKFENHFGLNIDDKFIGIYGINSLKKVIDRLANDGYIFNEIIIEHVKGYNLIKLSQILKQINLKIILCIHDFYFVCNTFNLMKNHIEFCGLDMPSDKKCKTCHNYKNIFNHMKMVKTFFENTDELIEKVVFPSEFSMNKWLVFFSKFKKRSIVREHLDYSGSYKTDSNKKLRIAYVGKKKNHKGYNNWLEIINNKDITNKYDLYYFGTDIDIEDNKDVKNIYTNNTIDNIFAMQKNLRKNKIDIVFLGSIIPETYSYTYYESSSANCVILCYNTSGNIKKIVEKNNNGFAFENNEDMINFLISSKQDEILSKKERFNPMELIDNTSIKDLVVKSKNYVIKHKNGIIVRNIFLTILYKIKKRV